MRVQKSFACDSQCSTRPFVAKRVKLYPEASLEYFEQEVLTAWARAVLRRDLAAATVTRGASATPRHCDSRRDSRSDVP